MEGDDETQDAPPPKPTTRVTSSGRATEPNDMSMAEVPTPTAGAPDAAAKSYAKAARQGAGATAHGAGPKLSKTAQQLKQRRLWIGQGKSPTGETMTPKGAPQEAVASSASDSAQEVLSSPEVIETEDTKSAGEYSPSGVSNIMENNSLMPIARLTQIDERAGQ
eukprot:2176080-Prymnesium_polylepis.1